MKAKKIVWTILLVLCTIVFFASLALPLLVPEQNEPAAESELATVQDAPQQLSFDRRGGTGGERPSFQRNADEDPSLPKEKTLTFEVSATDVPEQNGSQRNDVPENPGGSNRQRRRDRDDAAAEKPIGNTEDAPDTAPGLLTQALSVAARIRPYALCILIGSAAGIALCIVRLIFLARQSKRLNAAQADVEAEDPPPSRKKQAVWPAALLLLGALVLVAALFPAESKTASNDAVALAEVRSGAVEPGSLQTALVYAGSLAEQEPVSVSLPASVELIAVAVQNGDTVKAGQIIAKADKVSVMKAVAAVQEEMAQIDSSLQTAQNAKTTATLTAPAAGIVKTVYASVGDRAEDVMAEHGSLLLLSLDGKMSVELPAQEGLNAGVSLIVSLSDGTTVQGEVTDQSDDAVTVSVYDAGYPVGATVSVSDPDGRPFGTGSLSVHRPLNVIGTLGTISRIYCAEGSTVNADAVLIGLTDAADPAKTQALLEQRAEYEAELLELFTLYQNELIVSPTDGVVSDLSEDVPYRAVFELFGEDPSIRFAASSPEDAAPSEYVHYVGQVTGNAGGTLSLNISIGAVSVSDYTDLASLASADLSLDGTYTIPSTVPVYTYAGTWKAMPSASIAAGDLVVFAFDETGALVWVVCCPGAAPTPSPTSTPTPSPSPDPSVTPDGNAQPSASPTQGDSRGGSGGHSSGGSIRIPSASGSSSQSQKPAYTIARQTLLSITPQETVTLTVSADELDVLTLSVGQEATIYLGALSGTHFTGTLTEIDPEGVNSGGNTKYTVTLTVPRTSSMRAGMNATVLLTEKAVTNVLTIPLAALNEDGNTITVYTGYDAETDTLTAPVPVITGLSDGENVEIRSGLSAGDSYFYRYADAIAYRTE